MRAKYKLNPLNEDAWWYGFAQISAEQSIFFLTLFSGSAIALLQKLCALPAEEKEPSAYREVRALRRFLSAHCGSCLGALSCSQVASSLVGLPVRNEGREVRPFHGWSSRLCRDIWRDVYPHTFHEQWRFSWLVDKVREDKGLPMQQRRDRANMLGQGWRSLQQRVRPGTFFTKRSWAYKIYMARAWFTRTSSRRTSCWTASKTSSLENRGVFRRYSGEVPILHLLFTALSLRCSARVIDLGVAREFGALKPAGTPGYLPPEVMKILQGLSTDTSGVCQPENDVFALGVVLYTLLGSRKVYIHGKAHFPPCL